MTFPVPVKDIPIFEAQNPDISVNVISIDKYDEAERKYSFCIDYVSPHKNRKHRVNMLLQEDEEDPTKKHYTYISNFSRILGGTGLCRRRINCLFGSLLIWKRI